MTPALADLPCGNIIIPDNTADPDSILIETPIEDCNNPFGADSGNYPYTLIINNEVVTADSEIIISSEGTTNYSVDSSNSFDASHTLYLHDDNDYRFVEYIPFMLPGDDIPPGLATLLPGTYTLVSEDSPPILNHNNLWQKLLAKIIPTAQAQYIPPSSVYTITFTLVAEEIEPTGASSVLFLPGIQASRLYKKVGISTDEDRLWEPNINQDVTQLEMTEDGLSVNDIYTRDVVDEVFRVPNVYNTFLRMLEELEEDKVIASSTIFAYDWRYSPSDLVISGTRYETEIKSLITEVEELADSSFTGKVTIIGHSNGGLLGKELLTELERLDKGYLVDKIVFVGTPQLGTPKAIGVMLHGFDQVFDNTTRKMVRNMPGVYTLLPSQKYFDITNEPVVITDSSTATDPVTSYGAIDSLLKLSNFVLDTNNTRDEDIPINEPSTLNTGLMQAMVYHRDQLDNWTSPDGVEVYEIVGTGLPTVKGFEYRTFPCFSLICAFSEYMKPYPKFTVQGDETVVRFSSEGYEGDKVTAFVDLEEEKSLFSVNREHADLTESQTVQEYLDSIIRFPYLNETLEIPTEFIEVTRHYTIIGVHSPVQLLLEDLDGNKVGIEDDEVVEEVPGSRYFELGGSSYIITPTETEYTVSIKGKDMGVYSLTIDYLNEDDEQSTVHEYIGASTTPEMTATFTASSTGFSTIKTDSNGDGIIDTEQTLDGEDVVTEYSYNNLINAIKQLKLSKYKEKYLLLKVKIAKELADNNSQTKYQKLEHLTLYAIEATLRYYERKGWITETELSEIEEIINYLRK